jgi:DNA primase
VLTAYLAAISRKLSEPLAVLIVARSGAGKSALQDALFAFVPPEEAVRVTRLTGQALFYKDPYSLQRKVLLIAEDEGAAQAVYSLRTLASNQRLSIAATQNRTAEWEAAHGALRSLWTGSDRATTTSPEAFDEETRSRFVQLTMVNRRRKPEPYSNGNGGPSHLRASWNEPPRSRCNGCITMRNDSCNRCLWSILTSSSWPIRATG